jgi:hypothetical protein
MSAWSSLRTCSVIVALLTLVVFARAVGAQSWTVTYVLRGSGIGPVVCRTGNYEFLKGPGYTAVYFMGGPGGGWTTFIGMLDAPALGYPQASLPPGFPTITFPPDTDLAVAAPNPCP